MAARECNDASTEPQVLRFQLAVFAIADIASTIEALLDHGVWHILSAGVFVLSFLLGARGYRQARP